MLVHGFHPCRAITLGSLIVLAQVNLVAFYIMSNAFAPTGYIEQFAIKLGRPFPIELQLAKRAIISRQMAMRFGIRQRAIDVKQQRLETHWIALQRFYAREMIPVPPPAKAKYTMRREWQMVALL